MTSLLGLSDHEVSSYTSQGHINHFLQHSKPSALHCTYAAATRTTVYTKHLRLCETSYHMLRWKTTPSQLH